MDDFSVGVDRLSPVPLYVQAAESIERAIGDGTLGVGDRLDDEITLAGRFGLSRPTMRRAIAELVGRGLLVRRRGVGTQVVQGRVTRPVKLSSLFDDLREQHRNPSSVVLTNEVIAAPDGVAGRLSISTGAPVLHLRRLRLSDGEPMAILENYLPEDLVGIGATDLTSGGLYQRIRGHGVNIRVAKQRIGARSAASDESRLLCEPGRNPVLTMERAAYETPAALSSGVPTLTGPAFTPSKRPSSPRTSNLAPAIRGRRRSDVPKAENGPVRYDDLS